MCLFQTETKRNIYPDILRPASSGTCNPFNWVGLRVGQSIPVQSTYRSLTEHKTQMLSGKTWGRKGHPLLVG